MNEIKLTINPFQMGTEKEAAKKLPEEAAEAYAAWDEVDDCGSPELCRNCDLPIPCKSILALADEIADVIQASCNLAARYNLDLQAAMRRCEQRNRSRGRYPTEEKHVESCADAPVGVDNLPKSPEDMSVEELIEALYLTSGSSYSGKKCLGDDWCKNFNYCSTCRNRLIGLLKAAHEREIDDLAHECDGLRNRLAELNEAGITSLHRLLREAMGEAKNITHNARVYIDKQQGSKDEHCGNCGSVWRNHGVDCGAERVGERVLSEEPPAQEISEREKVLERLRGYDVYMTESPSKNANRLYACITGNKDADIACGNDIEAVRDKLIRLIGEGGAE